MDYEHIPSNEKNKIFVGQEKLTQEEKAKQAELEHKKDLDLLKLYSITNKNLENLVVNSGKRLNEYGIDSSRIEIEHYNEMKSFLNDIKSKMQARGLDLSNLSADETQAMNAFDNKKVFFDYILNNNLNNIIAKIEREYDKRDVKTKSNKVDEKSKLTKYARNKIENNFMRGKTNFSINNWHTTVYDIKQSILYLESKLINSYYNKNEDILDTAKELYICRINLEMANDEIRRIEQKGNVNTSAIKPSEEPKVEPKSKTSKDDFDVILAKYWNEHTASPKDVILSNYWKEHIAPRPEDIPPVNPELEDWITKISNENIAHTSKFKADVIIKNSNSTVQNKKSAKVTKNQKLNVNVANANQNPKTYDIHTSSQEPNVDISNTNDEPNVNVFNTNHEPNINVSNTNHEPNINIYNTSQDANENIDVSSDNLRTMELGKYFKHLEFRERVKQYINSDSLTNTGNFSTRPIPTKKLVRQEEKTTSKFASIFTSIFTSKSTPESTSKTKPQSKLLAKKPKSTLLKLSSAIMASLVAVGTAIGGLIGFINRDKVKAPKDNRTVLSDTVNNKTNNPFKETLKAVEVKAAPKEEKVEKIEKEEIQETQKVQENQEIDLQSILSNIKLGDKYSFDTNVIYTENSWGQGKSGTVGITDGSPYGEYEINGVSILNQDNKLVSHSFGKLDETVTELLGQKQEDEKYAFHISLVDGDNKYQRGWISEDELVKVIIEQQKEQNEQNDNEIEDSER